MSGVYDLHGSQLFLLDSITPEKYGAVGDGETDDTQAIQSAFTEAATENKPVSFGFGKIYAISGTINITKRHDVYGNGSVLKAISSVTNMIYINTESTHFPWSLGKGLITNLALHGNRLAQNGIYVKFSAGYQLQNIDIGLCTGSGVYLESGFEIFCNNIRVTGGGTAGTVGINAEIHDSHFSNIVTVNVEKGIIVGKTNNFFSFIHSWNTTASLVPISVMFVAKSDLIVQNVYCDTCAILADVTANCSINLSGTKVLVNPEFMNAEIMGGVVPKVFNLASSASTARIKSWGMVVDNKNLTYSFSNRTASQWTDFDWRKNNDTSITNLGECPQ